MELGLSGWVLAAWCMMFAFSDIPTERPWMGARMGGFRISAFDLQLFTFIVIYRDIANTTACLLP